MRLDSYHDVVTVLPPGVPSPAVGHSTAAAAAAEGEEGMDMGMEEGTAVMGAGEEGMEE